MFGSTSPWPAWGLSLVAAGVFGIALAVAVVFVASTTGFGRPSKRRTTCGVLLAGLLVSLAGYDIATANRRAARHMIVEIQREIVDDRYDDSSGIRVNGAGLGCHNAATANSHLVRTDRPQDGSRLEFDDLDAEQFAARLGHFDEIAQDLERLGYDVVRSIRQWERGGGQHFALVATDGFKKATLTLEARYIYIFAFADRCLAADDPYASPLRVDTAVPRFDLEAVCTAPTILPPFPQFCE